MGILDWVENKIDCVIISVGELIKTFVKECWRLFFRIVVFFLSILLGFIHKPSFETWVAEQRRGIQTPIQQRNDESETNFASLIYDLLDERRKEENTPMEKRSRSESPGRARSKKKKVRYEKLNVNKDRIYTNDKLNTGLVEDFRLWSLLQIDRGTAETRDFVHWVFSIPRKISVRGILHTLSPLNIITQIVSSLSIGAMLFTFFVPSSVLGSIHLSVDKRATKDLVKSQGYPYESYEVTTEDGYILNLERLPRRGSKKVLYFQHGVVDNSFAWFGHIEGESASSLAFRAYDEGHDIFVGTFRGCEGSMRHTNPNITSAEYWDFSVNEHGIKDLPAFLNRVKAIKQEEGIAPEDLKLTIVAHSMGAMATLMHMVWSRLHGKDHNLSAAILLSPAGYHKTAPSIVHWMGPLINVALAFFPFIHTLKFPGEFTRIVVAKVMEDVTGSFTGRSILSYLVSKVIGGSIDENAYVNMRNITYNIFSGTSTGVYRHFWQIWRSQRFEAFDYGVEKNKEVYGTPYPTNILENFDKIDIPVYFVMGLRDTLIEPVSIMTQYATMKDFHSDLAHLKAFPRMGHIDFTVGANEALINYILETVEFISTQKSCTENAEEAKALTQSEEIDD